MPWARVKQFKPLSDVTTNCTDPPPLPELGRSVSIMKLLELIRDYLRSRLGIRQISLSYVVRVNVTPTPIVDDPMHLTKPHSSNYVGCYDELITRASHYHVNFVKDSASDLDTLVGALKATSHMTSLKLFLCTRDGRGALQALEIHIMGNSKWDEVIRMAEEAVLNTHWNGKNVRYPLDMHIESHRSSFNEMTRAGDSIPYEPPNDHTRVQRLLNSIQSSDLRVVYATIPILVDNVKGTILKKQRISYSLQILLLTLKRNLSILWLF